jgi:hypothetical protein
VAALIQPPVAFRLNKSTLSSVKKTLQSTGAALAKPGPVQTAQAAEGKQPAWVKHAGWASDDPLHIEAAKLGAKWRKRENRKPALPDARGR